jgi:hypothetical protein
MGQIQSSVTGAVLTASLYKLFAARYAEVPHITAANIAPMEMDARQALEQALYEMQRCQEIFTSWRASLDQYVFA